MKWNINKYIYSASNKNKFIFNKININNLNTNINNTSNKFLRSDEILFVVSLFSSESKGIGSLIIYLNKSYLFGKLYGGWLTNIKKRIKYRKWIIIRCKIIIEYKWY
jgi:ribosomal protein S2